MTTAIAERPAFSIEPITYPVIEATIAELAAEYMPLTIAGVNDRKGEAAVCKARITVKNLRVSVEKRRKELKASALEYGKQVDSAAKALVELLEPIESHLEAEEARVKEERERIAREAEEARKAKIKQRYDALQACGYTGDMVAVPDLSDEDFEKVLAAAKEAKAEADRLAEIERQRQAAEQERLRKLEEEAAEQRRKQETELAAERERLAEVKRKQDEEAARLRAEQERIEAERQAVARAAELERTRQEAAEKARIETEQRIAREQEEARLAAERKAAQERAEAEAKEAARQRAQAMRPQREKLHGVAAAVLAIQVPAGPGNRLVVEVLAEAAVRIQQIADGLGR